MKIICSLGVLITCLVVAFMLGVAAGVRIAAESPEPRITVALGQAV